MFPFLIAHKTGDNEVAELFPNKPRGLLGNTPRAPALEVSEELKLPEF